LLDNIHILYIAAIYYETELDKQKIQEFQNSLFLKISITDDDFTLVVQNTAENIAIVLIMSSKYAIRTNF
jgi:hypothetical protein